MHQTTCAAVKVLREKTVNTITMTAPEELGKLLKDMQETQKKTQRQLSQLQRDVAAGQLEATKKVVQKLEEDKTTIFKKKGNEIQF